MNFDVWIANEFTILLKLLITFVRLVNSTVQLLKYIRKSNYQ